MAQTLKKRRPSKIGHKQRKQMDHFSRRCAERLNIHIKKHEHDILVKMIQSGEMEFIEAQSNRVSMFRHTMADESVRIVYDKHRKQIITVLFDDEEKAEFYRQFEH